MECELPIDGMREAKSGRGGAGGGCTHDNACHTWLTMGLACQQCRHGAICRVFADQVAFHKDDTLLLIALALLRQTDLPWIH